MDDYTPFYKKHEYNGSIVINKGFIAYVNEILDSYHDLIYYFENCYLASAEDQGTLKATIAKIIRDQGKGYKVEQTKSNKDDLRTVIYARAHSLLKKIVDEIQMIFKKFSNTSTDEDVIKVSLKKLLEIIDRKVLLSKCLEMIGDSYHDSIDNDRLTKELTFLNDQMESVIYREFSLQVLEAEIKVQPLCRIPPSSKPEQLNMLGFPKKPLSKSVPSSSEPTIVLAKVLPFGLDSYLTDINDIYSMVLTNKQIKSYYTLDKLQSIMQINLKRIIERAYNLKFDEFSEIIRNCNAILSGSTTLQCFHDPKEYNDDSDLDIYIRTTLPPKEENISNSRSNKKEVKKVSNYEKEWNERKNEKIQRDYKNLIQYIQSNSYAIEKYERTTTPEQQSNMQVEKYFSIPISYKLAKTDVNIRKVTVFKQKQTKRKIQIIQIYIDENIFCTNLRDSKFYDGYLCDAKRFKSSYVSPWVRDIKDYENDLGSFVVSHFDFSFLQNFFDGSKLKIGHLGDIVSKSGTINKYMTKLFEYRNEYGYQIKIKRYRSAWRSRSAWSDDEDDNDDDIDDDINPYLTYFYRNTILKMRLLKYKSRGFHIQHNINDHLFY